MKRRRGAVAVEMALVTPLLLTLVFGIIQYGWMMTVRQGLVSASREGARIAALQGATDQQINDRVNSYLQPLNLTGYTITLTHATQEHPIETVNVRIPKANVSLVGNFFGAPTGDISATCSMRKEGLQQ